MLGEALGYTAAEIAGIVGRSDAAVRQLAHRARKPTRPGALIVHLHRRDLGLVPWALFTLPTLAAFVTGLAYHGW